MQDDDEPISERLPQALFLIDNGLALISADPLSIYVRSKIPTMVASILEDGYHAVFRDPSHRGQIEIYICEDEDTAQIAFKAKVGQDGSVDPDLLSNLCDFFDTLEEASELSQERVTVVGGLFTLTLWRDGEGVLPFLEKMQDLEDVQDYSLNYSQFKQTLRRSPFSEEDFKEAMEEYRRQEAAAKDGAISPTFTALSQKQIDQNLPILHAADRLHMTFLKFFEEGSFETQLEYHEGLYRHHVKALTQDCGTGLRELLEHIKDISQINGISINPEAGYIESASAEALDTLITHVSKTMELDRIRPDDGHYINPYAFWGMPSPQCAEDYAVQILQGISKYHLGCSDRVFWHHQRDENDHLILAPEIAELSEGKGPDRKNLEAFLDDLSIKGGAWEGVSIDSEHMTIDVADLRDFCSLMETFQKHMKFKLGNGILNTPGTRALTPQQLVEAEAYLESDPTVLIPLNNRTYISRETLLNDVVRLMDAADCGRFVCPHTSDDLRKALIPKSVQNALETFSIATPTLGGRC